MPNYEFKCQQCGLQESVNMSVKEYRSEISCLSDLKERQPNPICGGMMKRIYDVPQIYWRQGSPTK